MPTSASSRSCNFMTGRIVVSERHGGNSGHALGGDGALTYYLIHLGDDVVQCPGDYDIAVKHLQALRVDAVNAALAATGRKPDSVPWLIGVYPPCSIGGPEGKGGVYSYGYTPTLIGEYCTPRAKWQRVGSALPT